MSFPSQSRENIHKRERRASSFSPLSPISLWEPIVNCARRGRRAIAQAPLLPRWESSLIVKTTRFGNLHAAQWQFSRVTTLRIKYCRKGQAAERVPSPLAQIILFPKTSRFKFVMAHKGAKSFESSNSESFQNSECFDIFTVCSHVILERWAIAFLSSPLSRSMSRRRRFCSREIECSTKDQGAKESVKL